MNYSFYDELDELDDIITESSDDETFIETMEEDLGLNDPRYGIFEEKKTSSEYALEKFKKKYHYDSKSRTILVDGTRYKVNITFNNNLTYVTYGGKTIWSVNTTSTSVDDNGNTSINIDKNFFKLKGQKRRDAALQHEVGHSKLHMTNPLANTTDMHRLTKDMLYEIIQDSVDSELDKMRTQGILGGNDTVSNNRLAKNTCDTILKKMIPRMRMYSKYTNNDDRDNAIRMDARNAAKKYLPLKVDIGALPTHTTSDEFEADRYAANRTSEKDMRKSTRNMYKLVKKDVAKERDLKDRVHASYLNSNNVSPSDRKKDDRFNYNTARSKMKVVKTTGEANRINYAEEKRYKDMKRAFPKANIPSPKQAIAENRLSIHNKLADTDMKQRSKALKDKELRNNTMLK